MKIIVVGAGIGGLSLAISLAQSKHDVLVLESAAQLAELGAGIQMTPQAVKYFFQWGLKEDILAECIIPEKMYIRSHDDGAVIGSLQIDDMERQYGAPYIVAHRAVLHAILKRHAVRAGAKIRLNSRVTKYDFDNGVVDLIDGTRLEADLVVAADGINSFARSQLLQSSDPGSQPTGWAAYRMMAEVSAIKADPDIAGLADLDSHSSNFWVAPDISCMTYLVKDATVLNIVLSHRDDVDTTNFTQKEYKAAVQGLFKGFEFPVRRLDISLPRIANYPVYEVPPLPHWTHSSGRFTLAGDAAHAMAFYLSMGVSLAVEDAVSLTSALDLACPSSAAPAKIDKEGLKLALNVFQKVRMKRAQAVQRASLRAGDLLHVPDGRERCGLYESMSGADGGGVSSGEGSFSEDIDEMVGSGWITDKRTRDWCYGYDAVADITRCYESNRV